MQSVIFGTAGHIDHGKTALVKALTGINTDRLKEEQARGITIELGYAFLSDDIAIIDVPGHEKFIKHMVAGVATVDYAVLVVAADDGVMPQTQEHFDILRLLDVRDGLVVITKCDLAEEDWIDLVEQDIDDLISGSFLADKPKFRVDSLSGRGIDPLRQALFNMAATPKQQVVGSFFRLPVDRVFTIKGFGTVVTGSALSGALTIEDKLELLPAKRQVRVRGIESQGDMATKATGGMRLALNLSAVAVDDISRGDVLATPGRLEPTFMLDVNCRVLQRSPVALEQRQRVRLHLGTKEVMARAVILDHDRLEPGQEGFVQLRLEARVSAQRLDRYVIRRYSPQITIGGGRILDANPQKHRKRHISGVIDTLESFGDARTEGLILKILEHQKVLTFDDLVTKAGLSVAQIEEVVGNLCIEDDIIELEARGARYLCSRLIYNDFEKKLISALTTYHKKFPLRGGVKRNEILSPWKKILPDFVLRHFVELAKGRDAIQAVAGDLIARHDFSIQLTKRQRQTLVTLEAVLKNSEFRPPNIGDLAAKTELDEKALRQMLQVLVDRGEIINLEGKIYFHCDAVKKGIEKLSAIYRGTEELTMSEFRSQFDTSRKYSIPLLNYYDSQGFTVRRGDVRIPGPKLHKE